MIYEVLYASVFERAAPDVSCIFVRKHQLAQTMGGTMQDVHVVTNIAEAEDFDVKHFPTLTVDGNVVTVEVGKDLKHPQTEEHYIDKIDLYVDGELFQEHTIRPDEDAFATFTVEGKSGSTVYALSDCNIHGVWKSEEKVLG